jgi:hypothetical protein
VPDVLDPERKYRETQSSSFTGDQSAAGSRP